MTEEFNYAPPLKHLMVGICGLVLFFILGSMIKIDNLWVSIICGIFSLIGLAMAMGFLTLFFRKRPARKLRLGSDFIEIPGRRGDGAKLNFSEIQDIGEFDTYDNVIIIESHQGTHLIEREWMKKKEFEMVKAKLREVWVSEVSAI
ncbi:hypothetical protein [Sanyastnella coralliicola]|uniref:hypothetical protein n=1 Tax=Sanyastnella coralliicola TaxID=3069118 RepID=UPI0027BAB53E|nr:hypothetical protein [Longitalea sp. SCSIO 12813]